MSNIAGKAYAMNVVTPTRYKGWVNRAIFWLARSRLGASRLTGLVTLSLIHYARWVIVSPKQFPNLGDGQPKETIKHSYELFYSNFNGSWDQYVDSFSMSLAKGLNLLWFTNINYPNSIPIRPFHAYITANQVMTDHYYNAYPLASSNDVKSGARVIDVLGDLAALAPSSSPEAFEAAYNAALIDLQHDLGRMRPTPIVSLAHQAVTERERLEDMETVIDARSIQASASSEVSV